MPLTYRAPDPEYCMLEKEAVDDDFVFCRSSAQHKCFWNKAATIAMGANYFVVILRFIFHGDLIKQKHEASYLSMLFAQINTLVTLSCVMGQVSLNLRLHMN